MKTIGTRTTVTFLCGCRPTLSRCRDAKRLYSAWKIAEDLRYDSTVVSEKRESYKAHMDYGWEEWDRRYKKAGRARREIIEVDNSHP